MEAFLGGMGLLLDPHILLVVFAGTLLGIVVGAGPWKAQLDEFMVEGKKTLEALGLLK